MGATDRRRPATGFEGAEVIEYLGKTRRMGEAEHDKAKGGNRPEGTQQRRPIGAVIVVLTLIVPILSQANPHPVSPSKHHYLLDLQTETGNGKRCMFEN